MKTVVTGAGGFIGTALVNRLLLDGHHVTAIVRRPSRRLGAARVAAHQLGEPLPEALLSGVDLVVHLAHDMALGSRNIEGTKRWFEQARAAAVGAQVYVSSYSADRNSPSEYGKTKHALETYAAAHGGVIVRPGLVLGNGGAFGAMAAMVRRFALLPVPGGDLQVFVTDLRDMVSLMASIDRSWSAQTLNLFAANPVTLRQLLERTRIALKRRGRIVPIPAVVALPAVALASLTLPTLKRYRDSLRALQASQSYSYASSYPALGLVPDSLDNILTAALAPQELSPR